MNWLAPALLCGITSEVGGVREALYAQLTDNYSNEGATRGLPQLFTQAVANLNLPACFKSIGYIIGPLQTWKGSDNQPCPYGGVVLILSGSEPTDSSYLLQQTSKRLRNII